MWPKLFAQLVEILPHVSRLIPMADRFFQSKAANDRANDGALAAMAEGMRGDLGQVTAAHAGLYRMLKDQGVQVGEIATDLRRVQVAADRYFERAEVLELQVAALARWVKVAVGLLVLLLAIAVSLLVRLH